MGQLEFENEASLLPNSLSNTSNCEQQILITNLTFRATSKLGNVHVVIRQRKTRSRRLSQYSAHGAVRTFGNRSTGGSFGSERGHVNLLFCLIKILPSSLAHNKCRD